MQGGIAVNRSNGRHCQGLTLVEALVTVAILGIIAGIAIPAFNSLRETLRLKGSAESLMMELRWAKSESIKRSASLTVSFREGNDDWCFGFTLAESCNCQQPNSCVMDAQERTTNNESSPGISLAANVSNKRFTFNPRRGTVTAGNIQLTGRNGKALRVVVSGLGRIRMCSPSGDSHVSGYPSC
jgi:prepilin-type N-terminal cleavage/methylation domain-containing protein